MGRMDLGAEKAQVDVQFTSRCGGFHGHGGTPKWLVYNEKTIYTWMTVGLFHGKSQSQMDHWGVPLFSETTICTGCNAMIFQ